MFVFVSLSPADPAPAALSAAAVLEVAEREGRTFVVPRARVETLGYQYTYPCRCAALATYLSQLSTHIYVHISTHLTLQEDQSRDTLQLGRCRYVEVDQYALFSQLRYHLSSF